MIRRYASCRYYALRFSILRLPDAAIIDSMPATIIDDAVAACAFTPATRRDARQRFRRAPPDALLPFFAADDCFAAAAVYFRRCRRCHFIAADSRAFSLMLPFSLLIYAADTLFRWRLAAAMLAMPCC